MTGCVMRSSKTITFSHNPTFVAWKIATTGEQYQSLAAGSLGMSRPALRRPSNHVLNSQPVAMPTKAYTAHDTEWRPLDEQMQRDKTYRALVFKEAPDCCTHPAGISRLIAYPD
jgi:hypothetical protein